MGPRLRGDDSGVFVAAIHHPRPLIGILLNGTSLSTRMSPGSPSTRSAMMLRMISSVPPSTRVPGARSSIAWNFPASSAPSPLNTPAAPCRSIAYIATSCTIEPATSLPIEFSGPGRSPLESAEIVRMLVYFSPLAFTGPVPQLRAHGAILDCGAILEHQAGAEFENLRESGSDAGADRHAFVHQR